jgi:hypothetical protein
MAAEGSFPCSQDLDVHLLLVILDEIKTDFPFVYGNSFFAIYKLKLN